jgi:hypothetical protein
VYVKSVAISINVTKRVLQTWRRKRAKRRYVEVGVTGVNAELLVASRLLIFFMAMLKLGRVTGNPAVNPDFLHTASAF